MKKNKKITEIVFLLDRSGSMSGSETDTIGGYNSYIKEHRKENINVTTILFDDKYEIIENSTPISKIKRLTSKEYYVRGCTALLDAIGKTIKNMDNLNKDKVIFIITTDGYENASHEYTKNQIKELIGGHNKWEFMYIGADIDSYGEGNSLGIKKENISNYKKDKKGINTLFKSVGKACAMYMKEEKIDESWKEELEK